MKTFLPWAAWCGSAKLAHKPSGSPGLSDDRSIGASFPWKLDDSATSEAGRNDTLGPPVGALAGLSQRGAQGHPGGQEAEGGRAKSQWPIHGAPNLGGDIRGPGTVFQNTAAHAPLKNP